MNFSLHISSLCGKSFDAYPSDDKADYLKSFCHDVNGNTLAMWSEHGVMYYYSMFRLPNDCVFGILLSFKDMVITRPKDLLDIMSGIVFEKMPKQAKILQYSASGDLVFTNKNFAEDPQSIDSLRSEIHGILTIKCRQLGCKSIVLPVLSPPKDVVAASISQDFSSIQNLIISQRSAIVVSTDATYTSDATFAVISGLQSTIQEKESELQVQSTKIKQLERSRKQYRFVLVLLAILCIAGIGLFKLKGTLTETEQTLSQANDTISDYRIRLSAAHDTIGVRDLYIGELCTENNLLQDRNQNLANAKTRDSLRQTDIIQSLNSDISNLEYDQRKLKANLSKAETDLQRANSRNTKLRSLMNVYPFLATGFSKAGSTLYISYNATASKTVQIEIRCFSSTSFIDKYTTSVSVKEGSGQLTIKSVNGLSSAQYVVVYHRGQIIAGQWF